MNKEELETTARQLSFESWLSYDQALLGLTMIVEAGASRQEALDLIHTHLKLGWVPFGHLAQTIRDLRDQTW